MDAPLALYRRYRPDTFSEVIGQDHVTAPLRNALSNNRVNHAYLFSGPRGCGKTTSARILARAINCEKGPIAEPCGVCQSCQDLARGGPGSIDVIEIDAASHGGVDDARDLRERAFFSPVQSRYKIYIIDEAHMVTTQGFNALLKLVEEPPPHLKFIFATTEPDKVIGTIRSRTHHYPFRLVPPKVLAEYLAHLCEAEGVTIAPAALPLVVRAGAGSVRDSLSVLDQLIGGADADGVTYQLTVSLLGFTPDSLLDACVDGFAAHDSGAVFEVIDKVIETGQDPKRFAEDLLRRLRDLVILSAVPSAVATGLIEVAEDQGERLQVQAAGIGPAELTRAADIVAAGLLEMRGATAPRLQLELICAKVLLPGADDSTNGIQARLDRIERRLTIGVPAEAPTGTAPGAAPAGTAPGAAPAGTAPGAAGSGTAPGVPASAGPVAGVPVAGAPGAGTPAASGAGVGGASTDPAQQGAPAKRSAAWPDESGGQQDAGSAGGSQPASGGPSDAGWAASAQAGGSSTGGSSSDGFSAAGSGGEKSDSGQSAASQAASTSLTGGEASPAQGTSAPATSPQTPPSQAIPPQTASTQAAAAQAPSVPAGGGQPAAVPASSGSVGLADVRRLWPEILEAVKTKRRFAWIMLSQNAQVIAIDEQTITLGLVNAGARESFARSGSDEILRQAMVDTIGLSRRVEAVVDPSTDPGSASAAAASAAPPPNPSAWDQPPPTASPPAASPPAASSPAAAPSGASPSSDSPGAQAGYSQPGSSASGGAPAGGPHAGNPAAASPAAGSQADSAGRSSGGQSAGRAAASQSSGQAAVGQSSSASSATGRASSGQTADGPPSAGQPSGANGSNGEGANGSATNGPATNRMAANGTGADGAGANGTGASGAGANGVSVDDPRHGGQSEHSPATASTAAGPAGAGPVTGLATGQQAGGPPAPAGIAEGAEQRREPAASKWRAAEATVAAERAKRAALTTQVEAPLTPEEEAEAIGEDDVVLEDDSRSHTELLRETLGAQIITEEPN